MMTPVDPPFCAPPRPEPARPQAPAPAGACDTHAHVFGPAARYAYSPARGYTPPDAPLEAYLAMHAVLGIARGVLVQPSVYGTDNRAILDAAARLPDRLRTVVAVDADVSDAELSRLDAAGARGIRVNLADKGGMPFDSLAEVERFARRLAPLGWHVELLVHVHEIDDMAALFGRFPVDIVIGHLGYMPAARGAGDPGFRALLALMEGGRCWVKLTAPYRLTARRSLPYDDVAPLAAALISARPDRVLWGSDWPHPHIRTATEMPDDGALFDQFAGWAGDETTLRRILMENPAQLYGFD